MSRGNRYNYTNVSMEYVIRKPEEFVIPECLDACKELWRKGIETFMCSNFDDEDSRWILISDLSKENIKKMDELSKHDSRYQFDENTHYYKIIVSNNEHAREELVSLARVFSIQDSNKYLSSKEYLDLYRRKDGEQYIDEYGYVNTKINPEHANVTLSEALKNNNDEHLYVSSEDRVYQSELYLYWHLRYLKSLQKKSKEEIKNIIGELNADEIKEFVIPSVDSFRGRK